MPVDAMTRKAGCPNGARGHCADNDKSAPAVHATGSETLRACARRQQLIAKQLVVQLQNGPRAVLLIRPHTSRLLARRRLRLRRLVGEAVGMVVDLGRGRRSLAKARRSPKRKRCRDKQYLTVHG